MAKILLAVVGPTAIGKTTLAITLAQHFKTEIVSADSRQFYKEMRIGTAVPSPLELNAAPHHFIQHKAIFEEYSVGEYETDALTLLNSLFNAHEVVVLVGGSGLYVDAVVKGLDYFPKIATDIRQQLNLDFQQKGIVHLQQQLKQLDPTYYKNVDTENPHRLIRALEVCIGSGRPYSSFLKRPKKERFFKTVTLGISAARADIYARINKRVDLMMQEGLLEEAERLYPHRKLNALQTVGYRELFQYFDGNIDLETAVAEIKKNTRRFAKRQLTWYRKRSDVHWIDYKYQKKSMIAMLEEKLTQISNEG